MNDESSKPARFVIRPGVALAIIVISFALWQGTRVLLGSGLARSHDEVNFLLDSMRLPAQRRLGGYTHGPLLYELLAVLEVAWYLVARLLGTAHSPADHLTNTLVSIGPHLKAGRMLVTAAGVACLIQVYRVGRLFAGDWAGLMAALLCATSLTFGVFTTVIKEDVFMWLFLLAAMELVWRSTPSDRWRHAAAGLAISAAFTAKYFAFFGLALALVPLARQPRGERSAAVWQFATFVAASGVGIVILYPFLIYDLRLVIQSLHSLSAETGGAQASLALGPYFLVHLPRLLGPVVGLSAIAELAIRLRREPRGPVLIVVPALILLGFVSFRHSYSIAYHVFFAAIVGFILASAFAARVASHLKGPRAAIPFFALLGTAVVDPAYLPSAVKYGLLTTGPDTRAEAAARIAALVPAGECVVMNGGVAGWNHFGPTLAPDEVEHPSGSGVFSAAERAAVAQRPSPHFHLHLVNGLSLPEVVPPNCTWLVEAKLGQLSMLELGPLEFAEQTSGAFKVFRKVPPPKDFVPIADIHAFPPFHTFTYPYMTVLDLDELRSISFTQLWRERKFGPSYTIYQRIRGETHTDQDAPK